MEREAFVAAPAARDYLAAFFLIKSAHCVSLLLLRQPQLLLLLLLLLPFAIVSGK